MALEAKRAACIHLSEEALEDYAFGRFPHAKLANFEEHLLACSHCQERLDSEDNFAEAVWRLRRIERTETVKVPPASPVPPSGAASSPPGRPHRVWLGLQSISPAWNFRIRALLSSNRGVLKYLRAPAWGAGIAGILAVGLGIAAWRLPALWTSVTERTSAQMAEVVPLKTLRGGGADGMAEGRPNRPLLLAIDFREGASSTAEAGPYRLEVVDAAGNQAWNGPATSSVAGQITARVEKRLSAGVYWVRLYAHSGQLLREFGMHLG